jgi:hypothetical protein
MSKSVKIWLSKSIFYVKNHPNLSLFFINENQFRSTLFVTDIFWWNQFLEFFITKMMPYFWQLQNSKFNNFLWVCWFLCKNLSNFVPPNWKLHNPYCHNAGLVGWNFFYKTISEHTSCACLLETRHQESFYNDSLLMRTCSGVKK